ncbi:MAG: hypothetical protein CM15mP120_09060 [Pseudomonadota bacterium]|nr:MAG: hypothetical protein CM15mP120_09060 [Pseudomonadota bacterium]
MPIQESGGWIAVLQVDGIAGADFQHVYLYARRCLDQIAFVVWIEGVADVVWKRECFKYTGFCNDCAFACRRHEHAVASNVQGEPPCKC